MTRLTRILLPPRVLLAAALLMSANATLVQYACGATGQAATTNSILIAPEDNEFDRVPCESADGRLHRILCTEAPGDSSSDETGCAVDLASEPLILQAEVPTIRPLLPAAAVAGEISSAGSTSSSPRLARTHRTDRSGDLLPIRLRISSLLL